MPWTPYTASNGPKLSVIAPPPEGKSIRTALCAMRLQKFGLDTQHRTGRCDAVAGALSRYPPYGKNAKAPENMFDNAIGGFI